MATVKTTGTQKGDNAGALENFSWDNGGDVDFFGTSKPTEPAKTSVNKVIGQIIEDDEDDIEEEPTKLETKEADKPKSKTQKTTDDDEDDQPEVQTEEEDEEEHSFFEEPKTEKGKKQNVSRKAGEEESTEDGGEDEDEEEEKGKKPAKTKGRMDSSVEEPAEQGDEQFFTTLAQEMIETGVFQHVKLEEGKKITQEEFFDYQDQEIEGRVTETFEAFFEEMDEDGIAFLKHKKNKGSTAEFFAIYGQSPVPQIDNFDPSNEAHRREAIASYLSLVDKMDNEEIEDRIQWLKENGKDKAYAEKYYNKLIEIDEAQKRQLAEKAEKTAKLKEENAKKFATEISKVLAGTEAVGNVKFTKEDRKTLAAFITKPTEKVGKIYIPPFNKKLGDILRADTPEAKQKLLVLAKLVSSDFDMSDLVEKVETQVVKKIKSKLKDAKNGVKPSSSGAYQDKKSLSDFFND